MKIIFISNSLRKYQAKKFYSRFIKKGDLCFDIGANTGIKSKLFLSLGAKVIAFEPSDDCGKYLNKIQLKNFIYIPCGVGKTSTQLELNLSNHIETATFSEKFISFYTTNSHYWSTKKTVSVLGINECIEDHGVPKFCKIDTEGYELEIVSALNYKIPIIEFEFTEGFFEETLQIIDKLKGSTVKFNFILNEQLKFVLNTWVPGEELKNALMNLPKKNLHGNIFVVNQ